MDNKHEIELHGGRLDGQKIVVTKGINAVRIPIYRPRGELRFAFLEYRRSHDGEYRFNG